MGPAGQLSLPRGWPRHPGNAGCGLVTRGTWEEGNNDSNNQTSKLRHPKGAARLTTCETFQTRATYLPTYLVGTLEGE